MQNLQDRIPPGSYHSGIALVSSGRSEVKFFDGKCTFIRDKASASLRLWFTSPEHFNKLIDGEKTIPVFVNVFKVGFLLNTFTKLAERLGYFLKPTDELLKDEEYFKINTFLTGYSAFFALCEVGNSDRIGKLNASRMPEGDIQVQVTDGPAIIVNSNEKHKLTASIGKSDNIRALMDFRSLKVANDILGGKTSIGAELGSGTFMVSGYLPMLDNLNKLLAQVAVYLA